MEAGVAQQVAHIASIQCSTSGHIDTNHCDLYRKSLIALIKV